MNYATNVIKKAKNNIIKDLRYKIHWICLILDTDDGDYSEQDDWTFNPMITIPVDNSYLDIYDDTYEQRKVIGIYVDDNERVYVTTEQEDEIFCENLTLEELEQIDICLEESIKELSSDNQ